MSFVRKSLSLIGIVIFWGSSVFGGVGSSGGGLSVVCRDLSGQIKESALLDIYEASVGGYKMKRASGDVLSDLTRLYMELKKSTADSRPLRNEPSKLLANFMKSTSFVEYRLPDTNDEGYLPHQPPEGCKIEQVAIGDDLNLRFEVDKEIWTSFDSLNKAALIMHEYLYQMSRWTALESTSWRIRAIVGTAASQQGLDNMYEGALPGESMLCRATSSKAGTDVSYVLFYPDPEESHQTVAVFTMYFNFTPMLRNTFYLPKINFQMLREVSNAQTGSALIVDDPSANLQGMMHKGSGVLDEERFSFEYSHNKLFTLIKLSETNRPLITTNFTDCKVWKGN